MKIRIGNDFKTKWAITWLGDPEDFSDATDIALFFNIYDKKIELIKDVDYTITDNIIEIDVTPDICNILGVYNLELHYTKPNNDFIDGERRSAVDIDAFRIVGKSENADATQEVSIISDAVAIFLDIAYKKLEEIEANEDVRIASENERKDAEDIRVENEDVRIASENERKDAEDIRVANEATRVSSEDIRISDEATRVAEEAIRGANEATRIAEESVRQNSESVRQNNEASRISAETLRVQAENERVSAEIIRRSNEDGRVEAENIRVQSEDERISEEGIRQNNEIDRVEDEGVRVQAESERVQAENERVQAESERVLVEGTRVQAEDERGVSEVERKDAEDIRVANENIRISNEQDRQINTTTAISNTEQATLNANNSATYANEQGAYAEEMSSHPPTIINDYWHIWNFTTNQYESTGQYARGDSAIDGALVVQEKGQSAVNTMSQKAVTDDLALKAAHGYESNPKTLKEVDDNLAQLAGDVNELGIKDAVQGAKIKDIENVLSTANLGQSTQVSVSGVSPLSLLKNAANSGMSVKLEGLTQDVGGVITHFEPTGRVRSVGKNLFDKSKSVRNMTINSLWQISYYAGENVTGYIPISDTSSYVISKNNTVYARRYILYDKNRNRIGTENLFGSTITPSVGTRFIRFSYIAPDEDLIILSKSQQPYEPYKETSLYLTAPELRSNGTVKDEIRKGANGYELVKRVGVGSLGTNGIAGGDFEGGLIGTKADGAGAVSTWALNTISPIIGTRDGRLTITTAGTGTGRPFLGFTTLRFAGQIRKMSFNYKVLSGSPYISQFNVGSSLKSVAFYLAGSGKFERYYKCNGTEPLYIYFDALALWDMQIDNIKDELIADAGLALNESVTELSDGTVLYTLATPVTFPISNGGILNSAENGTVYHEPVIADAGVYGTDIPIFNTDYPIASLEEIIKHENGVDTYLNVATAVIAGDGLSFTHPDLASGDLVLFTYAFSKETTNGNITATFYDSNVVKIDTVTGKAYKITDVVTNGVLTRTLTEV